MTGMDRNNNSVFIAESETEKSKTSVNYKVVLVWRNITLMLILHISAIYGIYIGVFRAKWETILFTYVISILSSIGVQAGTHRLWCHRSYKAKLPLRIFLAIFQTMALQNDIFEWSRDHRVHHKYSETDADPHNSKRGFFFSHIGWLLVKKHPDVIIKGKTVDMSDVLSDPVVRFQRSFYVPLVLLIWGFLPTYIPHALWGESLWNAYFYCVMFRYCMTVNLTWCVNR
jgi:stearoyl-CoA desaturase (delta-9 desaturase)